MATGDRQLTQGAKQAKKQTEKGRAASLRREAAGQEALSRGLTLGSGALSSGARTAGDAINRYETLASQAIPQYGQAATDAIGLGLEGTLGAWQPLQQSGNQAVDLYSDFQGLNGPEGFARAQAAWEGSPMYNALMGVIGPDSPGIIYQNRLAAQRGNPYNMTDILDFQRANTGQYFNNFMQNYNPLLNQAQNAAGAIGNAYTGAGQNIAGISQNVGQGLAGAYGNAAGLTSDVATGTGAQAANLAGQTAANQAQFYDSAAGRRTQESAQIAGQRQTLGQDLATNASQDQANKTALWTSLLGAAGKVGAAAV